jgi:hypothetical protein
MKVPNLDYIASKVSQKIAGVIGETVKNNKKVAPSDLENLTTKSLGILQSQGVYAMALFLFSRSGSKSDEKGMSPEERCATQILSWLWEIRSPQELIKNINFNNFLCEPEKSFSQINSSKSEMLEEFADLTGDLDKLLLVRNLYEKTLIYVRFHAKAAENKGESL